MAKNKKVVEIILEINSKWSYRYGVVVKEDADKIKTSCTEVTTFVKDDVTYSVLTAPVYYIKNKILTDARASGVNLQKMDDDIMYDAVKAWTKHVVTHSRVWTDILKPQSTDRAIYSNNDLLEVYKRLRPNCIERRAIENALQEVFDFANGIDTEAE